MKKLVFFLFLFSFITVSQAQNETATTPSPELTNCIQKIYNNPEAIKLLMKTMMADPQNMQQVHIQLKNDPEMREMMMQMRTLMGERMPHDMDEKENKMQHKQQMKSDTTGVK